MGFPHSNGNDLHAQGEHELGISQQSHLSRPSPIMTFHKRTGISVGRDSSPPPPIYRPVVGFPMLRPICENSLSASGSPSILSISIIEHVVAPTMPAQARNERV